MIMLPQRVRVAESRAKNKSSNGPLRVQSNEFCSEYSATCGHTSVVGNMFVFRKVHGFSVNQGGTANKILFVLDRLFCRGLFILQEVFL